MSELAAMGRHSTAGQGPPERESDVSDHNHVGCQEPMCQRCEAHSAGYRVRQVQVRCSRSRPGPLTIRQAAGVIHAGRRRMLRRRGGAGEWPHLDEALISEHDRDRPERGVGLDVGLALLLGIELGEGELP